MKFVDRLKFTAAGTSAATVTFGAAVAACRTLAQAITDGALVVGDTGVPFTVDDGVGNWETALFTVTSATVLTRTATLASSAGGTTPATFTGANLSVFNNAPASYLTAATASASVTGTPAVNNTLLASLPPGITGTLQWTRSTKAIPPVKTAIAGAVANAVNSLPYTITSADAGLVLGCDASNTVVASTGVAVPAGPRVSGVSRMIGTQAQQNAVSAIGYTFQGTIFKVQAPAGAIGVRVSVHHNNVTYSCSGVRVSVAPTDIAAIDTVTNAYAAQVNGVTNNATYDATNKPNGFRKATWKGAAQSRRLMQGNAVLPSFSYNNQEDTVTTDVIPLPGFGGVGAPIRARDVTPEQYYFVVRVTAYFVQNQEAIAICAPSALAGLNPLQAAWQATGGTDALLLTTANAGNVNDAVEGTYGMPASVAQSGNAPVLSFEWIYPPTVTPVTVMCVGDSITECYDWNRWAILRRSTPQKPLHFMNVGGSTTRTASYLGEMYLMLQTMAKPDYIFMPITSINNWSPGTDFTQAEATKEVARLQTVAAFILGLGIKLIWWTPINWTANPTSSSDNSTPWFTVYNGAKAIAQANGITWCDINGDPAVDRSAYNATTNPTGWLRTDNTHPSDPVGMAGFCRVMTATLASIGL